ncbi:actin filament-associated protein 1-like 2 isoform X2 [Lineus longissimus]|uniref:actin filament-associated protein 1-like 2 isoform X2 n=1 Tax=Lineus longissimus TaxID=88925 RepID=UPI002B4E0DD5
MDKIEERFPGLEEYIVKVLSKEQLSNFAEKRRQFYAECIEKLKLPNSKPPSLPPRNEGISFPSRTSSVSSISNANYDDVIVPVKIPTPTKNKTKNKPNHKPPPEPSMYFEYDSLQGELGLGGDERISPSDNFYEIPNPSGAKPEASVACKENGNYIGLDLNYASDSDTSYEPMDGDDQPGGNKQKVKKNKSKRASLDVQDGVGIKSFHNIVITGEIYYKMKTQWKKLRWSAITGNRLVGFLKERDAKQTLDVVLNGYDMLYVDRDGKRNHVIRISCPGCETYFIGFETKEKADTWLQHLNAAAGHDADGRSVALTSDSGISCDTRSPSMGYSSSESGSGDGLSNVSKSPSVQTSSPILRGVSTDDASKGKKGIGAQLTEFLGTFGKKKGKKAYKMAVDLAELSNSIDADVELSGLLNVQIPSLDKEWHKRWCQIRRNHMEVYHINELGHPDDNCLYSILLHGCDIRTDQPDASLTFKIVDTAERIICEAPSVLDQSDWVKTLMKETGSGNLVGGMEYCYIDERFNSREDRFEPNSEDLIQEDDYDDVYISPFMNEKGEEKSLAVEVEEILSAAQKRLSLSGNTVRSASPTVKDKTNDKSTKHIISTTSTKSFTSCKYESKTDKGSSQITVTTTSTSLCGPDDRPGFSTSLDNNSRSPSSVDYNSTRASSGDLNSYRMSSSDFNSTRAPSISSISSSSSSNTNTSSNVVPCSAGRTIDQDKELFKNLTQDQTYLSKVRAQKKTPHEKVRESIAKLKTKLERLKAKRASIRNQKAQAETFLEQRRLEGEFRAVDTEYKRIDNEIANLEKQLGQAPISIAVLQQQKEEEAAADQGPDSGSSSPRAGRSSVLERLKQFEALQRDK